jgi:hypothetical protein
MRKNIFLAALAIMAIVAVAPLFAQTAKGWLVRGDHSMNASDPDAAGALKFVAMGGGFHATNPMAAIYWNPANTAAGNYSLKGKFTLVKTGGFNEYYGLIFGGSELDGAGQSYLYFMISDDGTFLIKRRAGNASVQNVSQKTPNDAVKKPDASGKCTNDLEVRAKADKIDFVINGTVVTSLPKTGPAAKTDGIYGIRINHQLEVQIDGFGVSKM